MKSFWLIICILTFWSPAVLANELVVTKVEEPYAIVPIAGDFEYKKIYLGELNDFPIMYEFELAGETLLPLTIKQIYNQDETPIPFAIIMVKPEQSGGVTEVARYNPSPEDWHAIKRSDLGLTLWEFIPDAKNLAPGIYRFEISTPENQGKFLFTIGEKDQLWTPIETFQNVSTIHKFFDFSSFKILTVPIVSYPLGIILVLIAIFFTWRYHRRQTHAT